MLADPQARQEEEASGRARRCGLGHGGVPRLRVPRRGPGCAAGQAASGCQTVAARGRQLAPLSRRLLLVAVYTCVMSFWECVVCAACDGSVCCVCSLQYCKACARTAWHNQIFSLACNVTLLNKFQEMRTRVLIGAALYTLESCEGGNICVCKILKQINLSVLIMVFFLGRGSVMHHSCSGCAHEFSFPFFPSPTGQHLCSITSGSST